MSTPCVFDCTCCCSLWRGTGTIRRQNGSKLAKHDTFFEPSWYILRFYIILTYFTVIHWYMYLIGFNSDVCWRMLALFGYQFITDPWYSFWTHIDSFWTEVLVLCPVCYSMLFNAESFFVCSSAWCLGESESFSSSQAPETGHDVHSSTSILALYA